MSKHGSDSYEDVTMITVQEGGDETENQVKENHILCQQIFARVMMDETLIDFQIDCGATCIIILLHLLSYNKTKLHPLGKCKVKIRNPGNNKLVGLAFQEVDRDDRMPLLGSRASEAMQWMKVQLENILMIDSTVTKEQSAVKKESNCNNHITLEKIKTVWGHCYGRWMIGRWQ